MKKAIITTALLCATGFVTTAQPVVDITLAHNGAGQLEVRLRPDGPFNGLVSNLVFTLRWPDSFGQALSVIEPTWPQSEFLPLGPLPLVAPGNGYLYQTFIAVPFTPMYMFEHSWEGGMEYPVCTIDILAPGVEVTLGNDAFTAANNLDYFVSLNGLDRTGVVFESPVPEVQAMAINSGSGFMEVLLTPDTDYFGWVNSIGFTLRWPANGGSLGAIVQDAALGAALPMTKVGGEVSAGGFVYQRFHGVGTSSLARAQTGWMANEGRVLLRTPIIGSIGDATVAEDAWTSANGGTFSIVLNGLQMAGPTDEFSTGNGPSFNDIIPAMQVLGDDLYVTTSANGTGLLLLTVLNTAGQPLASLHAKWGTTHRIGMSAWPSGVYMLRVQTERGTTARRFLR